MGITRLWVAALAAVLLCSATAMAATLGGKLELDDEGSFFVNGQLVSLCSFIPARLRAAHSVVR